MKHLVENFVKQFEVCDPRKIMTKDTYKYISSLHRRHIFSDGKYGVRSNFIENLNRPTKKWYNFNMKVMQMKKHVHSSLIVRDMVKNLNRRDY